MPPKHHRPVRSGYKPWLPSSTSSQDQITDGQQTQHHRSGDNCAKGGGSVKDDITADGLSEDLDLDSLLDRYTVQAAAEAKEIRQKESEGGKRKRGMKERREEGLNKPLASDNKGFQLLSKMGYKEGQGLGRDASGRSQPVELDIRGARAGLGVHEDRKRQKQQLLQKAQEKEVQRMRHIAAQQAEYHRTAAAAFSTRRVRGHLAKAKAACESLDSREGTTETSVLRMFAEEEEEEGAEKQEEGDSAEKHEEDDSADEEKIAPEQQLKMVLEYLRSTHLYCYFCGCQYNDADDLSTNCPGEDEEDH